MGILSDIALGNLGAIIGQAKISAAGNTDEQALKVPQLYPDWETLEEGTYLAAGDRVNDQGVLYRVLQGHQVQASWTPADAPSLFTKILIPDPEVIPEWEQPGAENAYSAGDRVTHNGKTWESLVDHNVWEPGVVGTEEQWKEVEEEKGV